MTSGGGAHRARRSAVISEGRASPSPDHLSEKEAGGEMREGSAERVCGGKRSRSVSFNPASDEWNQKAQKLHGHTGFEPCLQRKRTKETNASIVCTGHVWGVLKRDSAPFVEGELFFEDTRHDGKLHPVKSVTERKARGLPKVRASRLVQNASLPCVLCVRRAARIPRLCARLRSRLEG